MSFTAHYNGPKYYKELADRSEERLRTVVGTAFGLCLVAYLVTAISGYVHFGEFTCGDVLSNYPTQDADALLARFGRLGLLARFGRLGRRCWPD